VAVSCSIKYFFLFCCPCSSCCAGFSPPLADSSATAAEATEVTAAAATEVTVATADTAAVATAVMAATEAAASAAAMAAAMVMAGESITLRHDMKLKKRSTKTVPVTQGLECVPLGFI
jgi:hypothetical protein